VTPYFNTGTIFHETARSVLGQSLQNFEWIIVNDGSSDPEALAVLDEYRDRDPRIRVLDHRVNHGLPAARNTGFRAARAPLVFQIDADDLIEPTTLEKCAWYLASRPGAAFVKGWSVGFGADEYLWTKGFHDGPAFLDDNLATATAMIRRQVHLEAGGCDETIRAGMEDWDFWVRCASLGHWGGTIPEYLDWYRRRDNQHDDWANLKNEQNRRSFRARLCALYPALFEEGGFPSLPPHWPMPLEQVPVDAPFSNPLAKDRARLLLIVPWLRMGGADRFNLDLIRFLTSAAAGNWEVTIATTSSGHPWLPQAAAITPDVFCMDHFLRAADYPRFLRGLIESRKPDVVMVSNAELGYQLLPFLRAHCPGPAYVDFNHMEEPHWRSGGHPRSGIAMQEQLDLNIVVSEHLKTWMVQRGADSTRIEVCYINADTGLFRPDESLRAREREKLAIGPGEAVILYAARFCAQKQPMVFAESIARLRDLIGGLRDRPAFTVLIAGDGEDRDALVARLSDLGLLRQDDEPDPSRPVVMLGAVPPERMPAIMAASDIFFLPSMWEGIALSIYEAMSAGLAVVGAAVGGQRELVTPETGLLLDRPLHPDGTNDLESEAERYSMALLDLLKDGRKRAAIGAAARQRIESHFELANMGGRMLDLLAHARDLRDSSPRQALPPGLARESAVQAIEQHRLTLLTDHLWGVQARYHELLRQIDPSGAAEAREQEAAERLGHIENSRTWKLLRAAKRIPPYSAIARLRWGPEWQEMHLKMPPSERLAMIESSRSFRLIRTLKGVPPWSMYVRARYGRSVQ
jgi:glycosyltransferase involved in cell wall biosynthesis